MGDDAPLLRREFADHDRAVGEREGRRIAEKGRGDDMRAGVERLRRLGER